MLLPRYFKFIGLLLAIPSLIIGVLFESIGYVIPFLNYHGGRPAHSIMLVTGQNNFTDELITSLLIIGLFFIGFSRQKNEDIIIANLRLKALFWAVLFEGFFASVLLIIFNSGLFRFDFIRRYDTSVLNLIINSNLFAILIVFVLRFYYLIYSNKEETKLKYISSRPLVLAAKAITLILLFYIVLALLNILQIAILDYAIFGLIPSILIWAWSGDKAESEAVESIRMRAMLFSVVFSYSAFIILTWSIYHVDYLVVQYISLASIPLVFIPVFYWLKHRQSPKSASAILAS